MNLTTQVGICNLALMRLGQNCDLTTVTGTGKPYDQIAASYDLLRELLLAAFPWHFSQKRVELDHIVTTLSGATAANPVVITVGDITDFPDGCLAEITNVDGMAELNNATYFLNNRNTTSNTTELFDDDPASQSDVSGTETLNTHDSINGTSYNAWTADGQLRLVPYGYSYAYSLPSDCLAVTQLMTQNGTSALPYEVNVDKLYTNLDDALIEYSYQITDDTSPVFHGTFIDCFAWRLAAEWAKPLTDDIDVQKRMWEMYFDALYQAELSDARQNPRDYSYTDPILTARG
jgi:hypothetical protein